PAHRDPRAGLRPDLRPRRRRRQEHPAEPARARGARAVLLERFGQDPARGDRVLRSPLQHRLLGAGNPGPGAPDGGPVSAFAPLRALAAALALGLALPACATPAAPAVPAAPETSPELRFVTCPVYRNTDAGRKSGCWLADSPEDGLRYDVTRSPTKPDWNRAVLVEGRVSAGQADTCGGIVLEPVRVSVLDQACPRAMLPAQGYPGVRFR